MVMIASDMNTRRNNKRGVEVFASLLLVVLTFTVYFQVRSHEFVVYDDRTYVSENPFIQNGFSVESTQWVFSFKDKDKTYWHPVTWLSHLLDIQLFGLNAGAHLVVNIVIHIINVLLLFSILNRCTGHMWRSAFVAALFALHPMNVESVAWVAARKNVLSTMIWMITLVAYIRYTGRPGVKRYTITVAIYTLGLMAKPMLVTLPFVLLLIDFWPLKRIKIDLHKGITTNLIAGRRLILEKIPLLILSAGSVFIAMFSLHRYGDVVASSAVDWNLRIANALVSYIVYIIKLFLPFNLTCFYPFPVKLPLWQVDRFLCVACRYQRDGNTILRQEALLVFWMVLVFGDAGAGDRDRSSWIVAGGCGSFRLHPLYRSLRCHILGNGGFLQTFWP